MSRVVLVVALVSVCIALSCTAKENISRCDSAFAAGRPCAIPLGVSTKERGEIRAIKEVYSSVAEKEKEIYWAKKHIYKLCSRAQLALGTFEDQVAMIEHYLAKTKDFLQEFTGLDVQESIMQFEKTINKANNQRSRIVKEQMDTCDAFQEFSNKTSEIQDAVLEIEKVLDDLDNGFSAEKLKQANHTTENAKTKAEELLRTAPVTKYAALTSCERTEALFERYQSLYWDMRTEFRHVEEAYNECYKEFSDKLKSFSARCPNEKNPVEKMRLQTCQKMDDISSSSNDSEGKEHSSSSNDSEGKEHSSSSNDSEGKEHSSSSNDSEGKEHSSSSNDSGSENPKPVPKPEVDEKDGAAHHAVLKSAFFVFVCLSLFF